MSTSESVPETLVSDADGFEVAPPEADERPWLPRGAQVGRYVILRGLGAGAMGVVYEAYDPELDRRVAIKLLRQRGHPSPRGQQRLLREAQALARLSHPHVVAVHDAGTYEGQIFLAMEFVSGVTLTRWLAGEGGTPRSRAELLGVFAAAGQGLWAAHRAGLVHRDFKPDNVMIGADGRARVMDFGLARRAGDESLDTGGVEAPQAAVSTRLTATGALMGTPAYMSPEQHAGLPTDPRTDQFSFCVALYEALHGERPFRGETLASLGLAVSEGRVEPPPRDSAVPPWLRAVLLRGLAAEADDRWPDMAALLEALADDPAVRRARRLRVAGAGLGLVGALGLGLVASPWLGGAGPDPGEARCIAGARTIDALWTPARRAAVASGLSAAKLPYASDTAHKVIEGIDLYVEAWRGSQTEACRATWVLGEQSEILLDARSACLALRRESLDYLLTLFERADGDVTRTAVRAVSELPPVGDCDDLDLLRGGMVPPADPEVAGRVELLRSRLARASTRASAGQLDAALLDARDAATAAEQIGYLPVAAEARAILGEIERARGAFDAATEHLVAAYEGAVRSGHDRVAAMAAAELIYVVGYKQGQHRRGEDWSRHALAFAGRRGEGSPEEAAALHYRGVLHDAVGRHREGLADYQRAYELRRARLGERHPLTLRTLNNLGNIYLSTGDYDRAASHYRAALEAREAIYGADHPELTGSLNNLALVLRRRGEHAEAIALLERAVGIVERSYGADHVDLAQYLDNLATLRRLSGAYDTALALDERALDLRRRHWGASHPDVGDPLAGLGATYEAMGQLTRAQEHLSQALALYEAAFAGDHPAVVSTRVALARVEHRLGAAADARVRLEGALGDAVGDGPEPVAVAEGQFLLARLLASEGGDEAARALELANLAREGYRGAGRGYESSVAEIDAWMAARGRSGGPAHPP